MRFDYLCNQRVKSSQFNKDLTYKKHLQGYRIVLCGFCLYFVKSVTCKEKVLKKLLPLKILWFLTKTSEFLCITINNDDMHKTD